MKCLYDYHFLFIFLKIHYSLCLSNKNCYGSEFRPYSLSRLLLRGKSPAMWKLAVFHRIHVKQQNWQLFSRFDKVFTLEGFK